MKAVRDKQFSQLNRSAYFLFGFNDGRPLICECAKARSEIFALCLIVGKDGMDSRLNSQISLFTKTRKGIALNRLNRRTLVAANAQLNLDALSEKTDWKFSEPPIVVYEIAE